MVHRIIAGILGVALTAVWALWPPGARGAGEVGSATRARELVRMDRVEELSEALANRMVELAGVLRRREFVRARDWFAPGFQGAVPFEGEPAEESPDEGIRRSVYPVTDRRVDRDAWIGALEAVIGTWRRIESFVMKVKEGDFEEGGGRGRATLYAHVLGDDGEGRPADLTMWMPCEVETRAGQYVLASLRIRSLALRTGDGRIFREVSAPAGIDLKVQEFADLSGFNWNWQGVATTDFDEDGWLDLFVPSSDRNHLYRNRGDGTFEDVAGRTGLEQPGGGTGAIFLDMDNDGDQDLFVCHVGRPGLKLYENRAGTFVDVSAEAGVDREAFAYSAAAADIDHDGLLDLYVACYNSFGRVSPQSWYGAGNGTPNLLFRNLGGGRFEEVAVARGVADGRWSYAVAFSDFDRDGDQDLYVANDYGSNRLYVNDGRGSFEDRAVVLGVDDPGQGMGVDWGDFDGDGRMDLYVMNMSSTAGNRILKRLVDAKAASGVDALVLKMAAGNSLFRNTGDRFARIEKETGTANAAWAWGGGFLDYDNDGWLDLFVSNGFITGKTAADT